MDNFEKHIREHKDEFDEQVVDKAKLWANIDARLEEQKPKVIPLWKSPMVRIAASILFLLGVCGIIGLSIFGNAAVNEQTGFVSKELQDIDMHYQSLVSYQVRLVQKNQSLSEADKAEFLSFIDDLDKEYEQLRLELRKNMDNELVLQAIISNYKKRIELIENLLRQINESKLTDDDYGYTL